MFLFRNHRGIITVIEISNEKEYEKTSMYGKFELKIFYYIVSDFKFQ